MLTKNKRPIKFATGGTVQPTPDRNLVASQFPNAAAPGGVLAPQVGNRTFDPYTNTVAAPTDTGQFDPYAHLTSSGNTGIYDVGYDQAPQGSPYYTPPASTNATPPVTSRAISGTADGGGAAAPNYSGALGLYQGSAGLPGVGITQYNQPSAGQGITGGNGTVNQSVAGTTDQFVPRGTQVPGASGGPAGDQGGAVPTALYSPGYGGTPLYPGTGVTSTPTIGGTTSPYPYSSTGQATTALTPQTQYSATPGALPNPLYPDISNPFFPGVSDKNLAPNLQQQKNAEYTTGSQLLDQYQRQSATSGDTAQQIQDQYLKSIAPLLAGQGGYTPEQQAAIMAQGGPFGLNTLDPNANIAAFQQGAGNVNAALGTGGTDVNQALNTGTSNVNAQINPAALRVSPQFQQDLLTQAANAARVAAQAQEQQNTNAAFAAGNVSPEALAAMNDRANQTGELAAADALTNARIQGEQARVAAEQQATNIQAQNAQENAQRAVGTQLQQEATNVGAQQSLLGAGQQATAAQQTQGMDLNQLESGRAQTVSNANLQAGQEGRAGLAAQGQQAQQTALTAGQQELGAYGTQSGATNQTAQEQITNKAANAANSPLNILLGGGAEGVTAIHGPVLAEVGEGRDPNSPTGYAPEAIVPVGPPKMAGGGFAVPKFGGARASLAPPAPPVNLPRVPKFAPRLATPGRFQPGLSKMGLRRSITRAGFQPIVPQFNDGGLAMPYGNVRENVRESTGMYGDDPLIVHAQDGTVSDPNLTDQDTIPGFWGPTGWQKALAIAGSIFPRLGAVANAIPGATWQDPNKPQVPEWQRVLGAMNPRAGKLAGLINPGKIPQDTSTSTVAPPPQAPAPGGTDAQKAFWQQEMGHIFQDPVLPKINDAFMKGGTSRSLNLPIPKAPSAGGGDGGSTGGNTGGNGGNTGGTSGGGGSAGKNPEPRIPNMGTTIGGGEPAPPGNRGPLSPTQGGGGGFVPPNMGAGFYNPQPGPTGGTGGIPEGPPGSGSTDTGAGLPPGMGNYGIDYGPPPVNPGDPNQPPSIPVDTGSGQLPPGMEPPALPPPDSGGNDLGGTPVYNPPYIPPPPDSGGGGGDGSHLPSYYNEEARGGVFAPFSKETVSKIPRTKFGPTEVVDRPQLRVLGKTRPEAVVPLKPKPGNRVKPSDIPKLTAKFGGRKQPAA